MTSRIIPAVGFAGPGQRGRAATPLPLRWPNHYPGLALDYGLDCTVVLADTSDTIVAVAVAIEGAGLVAASAGPAPNAAGQAGTVAMLRLRGGTAGTDYRVTVTLTTAQGLPVVFVVALYAGMAAPGSAPVPQLPLMIGPPAEAPLLGAAAGKFATVTVGSGLVLEDGELRATGGGGDGSGYTLPQATAGTLGGVKIGSNITVSAGTISLTGGNITAALGYTPQDAGGLAKVATTGAYADLTGAPAAYTLPQADGATLGGVKIGANITVASGTISLTGGNITAALGYTPQDAGGLAKVATTGAYADLTGTPAAYTLPQASAVTLGGVKIGANITVSAGTISLTGGNITAALGYTPQDAGGLAKVATTGAYADLTGTPGAYTLPQADGSTLGGVKIGSNITVSAGTISLTGGNITAALGLTPVDSSGAAAAAPVQSVGGATGAVALPYGLTVDWSQGAVPATGTITLDGALAGGTTIVDAVHGIGTAGGSITWRLQIVNGGTPTNITGLNGITTNSGSMTTSPASGANNGVAGDQLQLVITAVTGTPAGASISVRGTRP